MPIILGCAFVWRIFGGDGRAGRTLFEKLIRKTGAWGTLDIGHAQVSPSITSNLYRVSDFVAPHPEVVLNAHVYHEETDPDGHIPPQSVSDVKERLELLTRLPLCDWWLLELREEQALMQTLEVVREFFQDRPMLADTTPKREDESYGSPPIGLPLELVWE